MGKTRSSKTHRQKYNEKAQRRLIKNFLPLNIYRKYLARTKRIETDADPYFAEQTSLEIVADLLLEQVNYPSSRDQRDFEREIYLLNIRDLENSEYPLKEFRENIDLEIIELIPTALSLLPNESQYIVSRLLQGATFERISREIGYSNKGSVYHLWSVARETLKEFLNPQP